MAAAHADAWGKGYDAGIIDLRAALVPEPENTLDGWRQRALEAGRCTSECPAQIHQHGKHEKP